MTDWLSLAISEAVPIAPLAPIAPPQADPARPNGTIGANGTQPAKREAGSAGPIGANGTIGTGAERDREESDRQRAIGPFGANGTNGTRHTLVEEARAHIEVTANRLEADGVPAVAAVTKAVEIVRADLQNDPRIVVVSTDTTRCPVCRQGDREADPLLPVLSPDPARPHWVHGGRCHRMLRGRIADRVTAVMNEATSLRLVEGRH